MNNEPVAWMLVDEINGDYMLERHPSGDYNWIPLYTHPVKEQDGCGNCHACLVGVTENGLPVTFQRMVLCPDCGNKRCPKASNHRHQCTDNNELNQYGSIYSHPVKELTDENYKEALACLQFALDDTLDYIKLNNLGGENNHWIVWAKAILRKAQEK